MLKKNFFLLFIFFTYANCANSTEETAQSAFEKYIVYQNSKAYTPLNIYLSSKRYKEVEGLLKLDDIGDARRKSFRQMNFIKKMDFSQEIKNDKRSCLFYIMSYSENVELYDRQFYGWFVAGKTSTAFVGMEFESGAWKFDEIVLVIDKEYARKICTEQYLQYSD